MNQIVINIIRKIAIWHLLPMCLLSTFDAVADEYYSDGDYAVYKSEGYAYTFEGELNYSPVYQYAMPYPDLFRIFNITDVSDEISITDNGIYIFRKRSYGHNYRLENYSCWQSLKNNDQDVANLNTDSCNYIINHYLDYMCDEIDVYHDLYDVTEIEDENGEETDEELYYKYVMDQYEICVEYLEEFKSRRNLHGLSIVKGCYELIMIGDETNPLTNFTEINERFQVAADMDILNLLIKLSDLNNNLPERAFFGIWNID